MDYSTWDSVMRVTAHTQPVASLTESVCGWTVVLGTDVQRQHMYANVKLRQSFTLDGLYTSIWYGMSPIRTLSDVLLRRILTPGSLYGSRWAR